MQRDVDPWLDWMFATSIPLFKLDESKRPVKFASGTLVDHCGRRFLLSIAHAILTEWPNSKFASIELSADQTMPIDSSEWFAYMGYEPGIGTVGRPIGKFAYLGEKRKDSDRIRIFDFCCTEVGFEFQPQYQFRTPRALSDERPREIFSSSCFSEPEAGVMYAFSSRIRPELHGLAGYGTEQVVYPGLLYAGSEDEHHIFKLPVEHPGHEYFYGCSGSPILDRQGRVVALLCRGDPKSHTVRGISAMRCLAVLDFMCKQWT